MNPYGVTAVVLVCEDDEVLEARYTALDDGWEQFNGEMP